LKDIITAEEYVKSNKNGKQEKLMYFQRLDNGDTCAVGKCQAIINRVYSFILYK
jgi:hypothetical protein